MRITTIISFQLNNHNIKVIHKVSCVFILTKSNCQFYFNILFRINATNDKNRKLMQSLKKKSSRLFSRYMPRQSARHLNEREREEESEKLRTKYNDLQLEYNATMKRINNLFGTSSKQNDHMQWLQENSNSSKTIRKQLEKFKAVHSKELDDKIILENDLKQFQERLDEVHRKSESFESKSREELVRLENELKDINGEINEIDNQVDNFNKLKEQLQKKHEQIKKSEDILEKLGDKYKERQLKYGIYERE